ncbi:Fc receptor-like B isoform X2 [Toxotes jaculatrix]|uniref:Fc receptor-like B isoform X2 n=1 Tax=Toxotes jaculatrix TaxID=941984 RepID=UPI001B3AB1F8|nr:Fc receptor-like B isoform X2 [Toxotes jaculatrix]
MEAPSVSLIFGLFVLPLFGPTHSSISLNISPNRQQFFKGESVVLSCHGEFSSGWKLRRISVVQNQTCGAEGFGAFNGSSCNVSNLSPSWDRGVYWCEDSNGRSSTAVTITVSERSFIMEIPALPVLTGSDVTLRCRRRDGSAVPAHFFKFGRHSAPIKAEPTPEFTIHNVQQSDEGFYWCSTGQRTSASSRLSVRADPSPPTNSASSISAFLLVKLLCHLLVISPYCISTVLMVLAYCSRKTGNKPAVVMEMAPRLERGQGLDDEYSVAATDVTAEYTF